MLQHPSGLLFSSVPSAAISDPLGVQHDDRPSSAATDVPGEGTTDGPSAAVMYPAGLRLASVDKPSLAVTNEAALLDMEVTESRFGSGVRRLESNANGARGSGRGESVRTIAGDGEYERRVGRAVRGPNVAADTADIGDCG